VNSDDLREIDARDIPSDWPYAQSASEFMPEFIDSERICDRQRVATCCWMAPSSNSRAGLDMLRLRA
jgi:hypothetical protein